MNNTEAYNQWAATYDQVQNKTRDLESVALRKVLTSLSFNHVLEIGCGTGKNTAWLLQKANTVVGVDFSEEMLNMARHKIKSPNVKLVQMDIRAPWKFQPHHFDLITFSLVLEHIQNIDDVFGKASRVLKPGGYFYLGELHPFKQLLGSKARFESKDGVLELECFVHHISNYFQAGKENGLACVGLNEWFDEYKETLSAPRLLTMLFKK